MNTTIESTNDPILPTFTMHRGPDFTKLTLGQTEEALMGSVAVALFLLGAAGMRTEIFGFDPYDREIIIILHNDFIEVLQPVLRSRGFDSILVSSGDQNPQDEILEALFGAAF